ncbi:MAG: IS1 family transposase [Chloroflexota bacterium]
MSNKSQKRWLWLALCRHTRQVVAYWLGDHSEDSTIRLWQRLPREYKRCASFSDQWEAYRHVFDVPKHQMVDEKLDETNHFERWLNMNMQNANNGNVFVN